MKRKWDVASETVHKKCLDEVIAQVEDIDSETVGVIVAQDIIDIVTENLAPEIYNQGLKDARKVLRERLQDIEVDIDILEQR